MFHSLAGMANTVNGIIERDLALGGMRPAVDPCRAGRNPSDGALVGEFFNNGTCK